MPAMDADLQDGRIEGLADVRHAARRSFAAVRDASLAAKARQFAADGFLGVIAPLPHGAGMPLAFARPLVEEAAGALVAYPLCETLAASQLLAVLPEGLAAAIAAGARVVTLAPDAEVSVTGQGDALRLHGVAGNAALAGAADLLAVPAPSGVALVDPRSSGCRIVAEDGLDPGMARGSLELTGAPLLAWVPQGPETIALREVWTLLGAVDLLASAAAGMDLAVAHLSGREQFGRPLVTFQALRHDLARARLALENGARLLAWAFSSEEAEERGRAVAMAAAHAAEVCPGIAEMVVQMHGGMGFTWDVPAHRWLRRIRARIGATGAAELREAVIAPVIASALG